jgi:hypothetical protein
LFVVGALLAKSWAWSCGVTAAVINLLIVIGAVAHGGLLVEGVAWSVIPIILFSYLFSATGRIALSCD